MNVRSARVVFTAKVGLAQYSSVSGEVELSADLDEGDDVAASCLALLEGAREAVKATVKKRIADMAGGARLPEE